MIEINGKKYKNKDFLNETIKAIKTNIYNHEQAVNILDEANEFLKQGRKDKNKKLILNFKEITKNNAVSFKNDIINGMIENETALAQKILDQDQEIKMLKLEIKKLKNPEVEAEEPR